MFFALVAKGLDGKLLVDKKKIPAKEIAEAKKECGGGTIYQGRCQGEDNGSSLVFEVAKETPGTLPGAVKKIIKENTGLTFKTVVFRINVEVEKEPEVSVESPRAPGATPPSSPGSGEQAWKKQFAALEPDYLEILRGNPPEAGKLRALMAFATGKADAGEYAKALAGLKQVEALLLAIAKRAEAFRKQWKAAVSDLQEALDEVSVQLAEFAGALMESGEANLIWVAEDGLGQVLNGLRDSAMKIDAATSKSPAKVVAKARPAIAELRTQLKTPRVQACDNNQLGVTVTIQRTIAGAIKRLEAALALAGAG